MNFVENTLVGQARNELVKKFIQNSRKEKIDYVLWMDSDHIYEVKHFEELRKGMITHNLNMVSCLYFSRKVDGDILPIMYLEKGDKYAPIVEIPENKLIKVDGTGFGFILMRPKVLLDMYAQEPFMFTSSNGQLGEDLYFFRLAKQFGYSPFIDTSQIIRHVGGAIGIEEYLIHRTMKGEKR